MSFLLWLLFSIFSEYMVIFQKDPDSLRLPSPNDAMQYDLGILPFEKL